MASTDSRIVSERGKWHSQQATTTLPVTKFSNEDLVTQWRCQNAEKVTHTKGRLPYQAIILYN